MKNLQNRNERQSCRPNCNLGIDIEQNKKASTLHSLDSFIYGDDRDTNIEFYKYIDR